MPISGSTLIIWHQISFLVACSRLLWFRHDFDVTIGEMKITRLFCATEMGRVNTGDNVGDDDGWYWFLGLVRQDSSTSLLLFVFVLCTANGYRVSVSLNLFTSQSVSLNTIYNTILFPLNDLQSHHMRGIYINYTSLMSTALWRGQEVLQSKTCTC